MNTRTPSDRTTPEPERIRRDPDATRAGEASGQHQPVRRPDDDQAVEQRLGDVGLDDRGDALEDDLRDRRSRGGLPGTGRGRADGNR